MLSTLAQLRLKEKNKINVTHTGRQNLSVWQIYFLTQAYTY